MITRDEILEFLEYNPDTGFFYWKKPMNMGRIPAGEKAGSIPKNNGWVFIKFNGKGHTTGRLAWCIFYGEYPAHNPVPIDGDRSNTSIRNLMSYEEYREIRKEACSRIISHEELLEILDYDPDTGKFTWKVFRGATALAGEEAGGIEQGYRRIRINNRVYGAGRLAWFYMTGNWPENEIDHKDRNKLNNRFKNLRDVSGSVNCLNRDFSFMDEQCRKKISESMKQHWKRKRGEEC